MAIFGANSVPSNHPILFPKPISSSLQGLLERGFLTPTFFSALAMAPVLPGQVMTLLAKGDEGSPLSQDNLYATLFRRFAKQHPNEFEWSLKNSFKHTWKKIAETHAIQVTSANGIERIELIAKIPSNQYVIYYAGNSEDAMYLPSIDRPIQNEKFKASNFIFWNYPGVKGSVGFSMSSYDVFAAGLQQVQDLLARDVPAQNITLYGCSLGGGIASQAASRLPKSDFRPNLEIERSFSAISAVPLVAVREMIDAYPRYRPFYSAILACSLVGLSLGFVTAGFIATIGLFCATLIASVGYLLAKIVQIMRNGLELVLSVDLTPERFAFLDKLTVLMDTQLSKFALLVHQHIFNILGSIIGVVVGVPGLIVGSLVGVGIGAVLSFQTLFTDSPPLYFPLHYVFKWLTFVAHVEMNSVAAINHILADTEHLPMISSTNAEKDTVIPKNAALNTGLGFDADLNSEVSYNKQCSFFWYKEGNHNDDMEGLGRHYQYQTS